MGPKTPDINVFEPEFQNTFVMFDISTLKFLELQKFTNKQKCLKLGPKTPVISVFGPEFQNTIVIFESSTLKFVFFQNFVKNQKCLTCGQKCLALAL